MLGPCEGVRQGQCQHHVFARPRPLLPCLSAQFRFRRVNRPGFIGGSIPERMGSWEDRADFLRRCGSSFRKLWRAIPERLAMAPMVTLGRGEVKRRVAGPVGAPAQFDVAAALEHTVRVTARSARAHCLTAHPA
jgi:hypothetical protein